MNEHVTTDSFPAKKKSIFESFDQRLSCFTKQHLKKIAGYFKNAQRIRISRGIGQVVIISDGVRVTVESISRGYVTLLFDSPDQLTVFRKEIFDILLNKEEK